VAEVDKAKTWMRLKNDVMRAPPKAGLFAIILGTGAQGLTVYFLILVNLWIHQTAP